jgi:hypothetical protein
MISEKNSPVKTTEGVQRAIIRGKGSNNNKGKGGKGNSGGAVNKRVSFDASPVPPPAAPISSQDTLSATAVGDGRGSTFDKLLQAASLDMFGDYEQAVSVTAAHVPVTATAATAAAKKVHDTEVQAEDESEPEPAVVVAPWYGLDSEEQDGEQGGAAVAAATCTPVRAPLELDQNLTGFVEYFQGVEREHPMSVEGGAAVADGGAAVLDVRTWLTGVVSMSCPELDQLTAEVFARHGTLAEEGFFQH